MLKKVIIWALRIASIIVILAGVGKILENPKTGLTTGIVLIIVGAIAVFVTSKLRTKVEQTEFKKKQKTNVCANCGHSMSGAQYRYVWDKYQFDHFYCTDYEGDRSLPVFVTAICPKCGLEKEIQFNITEEPGILELTSSSFSKEAFVQRKIRARVENLLNN